MTFDDRHHESCTHEPFVFFMCLSCSSYAPEDYNCQYHSTKYLCQPDIRHPGWDLQCLLFDAAPPGENPFGVSKPSGSSLAQEETVRKYAVESYMTLHVLR